MMIDHMINRMMIDHMINHMMIDHDDISYDGRSYDDDRSYNRSYDIG